MVHVSELPPHSQLLAYRASGYTDCYVTELPFRVTLAQFIEAFYTTPLFKIERWLLGTLLRLPSTDEQANELASGLRQSFAAWSVEARGENQVLLAAGRTRSWLSVMPNNAAGAHLFFGSAVVPRRSPSDTHAFGFWFWALGGFHKLYSRALLRSARGRLLAQATASAPPAGAA